MGDWHLTPGAGVYLGIAIVALLGAATLFQIQGLSNSNLPVCKKM